MSLHPLAAYWSATLLQANLYILLHLLGALALGLLVGYERTYHGRAAGMRTYGLLCMSTAALTVIGGFSHFWYGDSEFSGFSNADVSRRRFGMEPLGGLAKALQTLAGVREMQVALARN